MEIARNIALVFLGGGLGASVRYGLTVGLGYAGVSSYIVLVGINLTGSLLIGLLVGLGLREGMGVWWFLLAVGILGGFTTLSTFQRPGYRPVSKGQCGMGVGLHSRYAGRGYRPGLVGSLFGRGGVQSA